MENKWSNLTVLDGWGTAGSMARHIRDLVERGNFALVSLYVARLEARNELHRVEEAVREGCLL